MPQVHSNIIILMLDRSNRNPAAGMRGEQSHSNYGRPADPPSFRSRSHGTRSSIGSGDGVETVGGAISAASAARCSGGSAASSANSRVRAEEGSGEESALVWGAESPTAPDSAPTVLGECCKLLADMVFASGVSTPTRPTVRGSQRDEHRPSSHNLPVRSLAGRD